MKVIVKGTGDYFLKDGVITEEDNNKFYTKYEKDTLVISNTKFGTSDGNIKNSSINIGGASGVSINGNTISINGISIEVQDGNLKINGPVKKITLNSKEMEVQDQTKVDEKDEGVLEYSIGGKNIEAVNVQGSGGFYMKDCKYISGMLLLTLQGSGDISCENGSISNVVATVQGSGDIVFKNIKGTMLTATVQGSGDIANKGGSNFDSVISVIQGSGDITGLQTA